MCTKVKNIRDAYRPGREVSAFFAELKKAGIEGVLTIGGKAFTGEFLPDANFKRASVAVVPQT